MKGLSVTLLLAACLVTACAGEPPPTLEDLSNDVRIDTLPSRGKVSVAAQELGPAPVTMHVQADQTYTITVALQGFEPRTISGTSAELLKNRSMEFVLAPQGFNGPAPSDTDTAGLTTVAQLLEQRTDWGHAAEFWRRVITLTPRAPRAHKGLGSCFAKLGKDELAIREYEQYIFLEPDAPDADRVRKAIDAYRGGIDLPSGQKPQD